MIISCIGHGYVGLVTAAVFADLGSMVWVVGRSREKIENLKKGKLPFYEPGLEELVKRNLASERLHFTLDYAQAVKPSEVIILCVGTPPKDNGEADLSSVFDTARQVGRFLIGYKVIATKSTVPPGTNKKIAEIIQANKPEGASFAMASLPEFLREGTAISDTLHPDRVVIGTSSKRALEILRKLHKPIDGKCVACNLETAELIKYASNALLSTKISFANAIAMISEKVGADAEVVLEGVGLDRRLGRSFLYPGIGYGGSCFPKDVKALIALSEKLGYDFSLLRAVDQINSQIGKHFVDKIIRHYGGVLKGKTFAILGLSFKPNTDDMREAPSVPLIQELFARGANIRVYDPVAMDNARRILPESVNFAPNAYEAAQNTHGVVIVTEWNEFRQLNLVKLAQGMKDLVLFDGRNIYEPEEVKKLGFMYYGVGRM